MNKEDSIENLCRRYEDFLVKTKYREFFKPPEHFKRFASKMAEIRPETAKCIYESQFNIFCLLESAVKNSIPIKVDNQLKGDLHDRILLAKHIKKDVDQLFDLEINQPHIPLYSLDTEFRTVVAPILLDWKKRLERYYSELFPKGHRVNWDFLNSLGATENAFKHHLKDIQKKFFIEPLFDEFSLYNSRNPIQATPIRLIVSLLTCIDTDKLTGNIKFRESTIKTKLRYFKEDPFDREVVSLRRKGFEITC
ncbi:MAG: hypothetical protein AB8G05_06335 [Oligoflexales bacterium]